MAGRYFDTSQGSDDLALLPSHLRRDADLEPVAEVVEADILARYTISTFEAPSYRWLALPSGSGWLLDDGSDLAGMVKLADYLYVRLRGYDPDPAFADANFKEAMRREVGAVLRWRLGQSKRDPAVTSKADGDVSVSYREGADEPFPPQFPMYLRPFVLQQGSWSL